MALRGESVILNLKNPGQKLQLNIRSSEATRRAPLDPDDMFKGGMANVFGADRCLVSPRKRSNQVTLSPGPIGLSHRPGALNFKNRLPLFFSSPSISYHHCVQFSTAG